MSAKKRRNRAEVSAAKPPPTQHDLDRGRLSSSIEGSIKFVLTLDTALRIMAIVAIIAFIASSLGVTPDKLVQLAQALLK